MRPALAVGLALAVALAAPRAALGAPVVAGGPDGAAEAVGTGPGAGWGVDGWLAGRLGGAPFEAYVRRLNADGIGVIRERGVGTDPADGDYRGDIRLRLEALHRAGIRVVAFASLAGAGRLRAGDNLPVDLLSLYRGCRREGRSFAGLVDGWEMIGEPDTGYCRDLPDRVAAVQKAMYLGLKAGAAEAETPERLAAGYPSVVMGALGLPPGPWLERARANGLLAYTDAYNFHFYGMAGQFTGVIRAQRTAAGAGLPLWVTECGFKVVAPGDLLNGARLRLEGRSLASAARQALDGRLALFMPFLLYDPGDPYELTLGPDRPLAPWNAYAKVVRSHPWPDRPWGRMTSSPDPVVVEWVPFAGSVVAHKVAGTYRFRGDRPILGEIRVFNLSGQPVAGRLRWECPGDRVASTLPAESALAVGPEGEAVKTVVIGAARPGYFRATCRAVFVGADGAESAAEFGVERTPVDADFRETPLRLHSPLGRHPPGRGGARPEQVFSAGHSGYRVTARAGPWVGLNGVAIDRADPQGGLFRVPVPTGDPAGDPLYPPFAVAAVDGLPPDGFIRLRPDRSPVPALGVRVDLVDADGARYTIYENLGQDYAEPRRDIWLGLRDFQPYFWGPCPAPGFLHPDRVREIQLRFYPTHPGDSVSVGLALMRAGSPTSVPPR